MATVRVHRVHGRFRGYRSVMGRGVARGVCTMLSLVGRIAALAEVVWFMDRVSRASRKTSRSKAAALAAAAGFAPWFASGDMAPGPARVAPHGACGALPPRLSRPRGVRRKTTRQLGSFFFLSLQRRGLKLPANSSLGLLHAYVTCYPKDTWYAGLALPRRDPHGRHGRGPHGPWPHAPVPVPQCGPALCMRDLLPNCGAPARWRVARCTKGESPLKRPRERRQ